MKAKVVSEWVTTDLIHGSGCTVKRLVVEEADNLAVTPHDGQVYAFTGFDLKGGCEVIGEVQVPDGLVEKALAFVHAKAEFDSLEDTFKTLLD